MTADTKRVWAAICDARADLGIVEKEHSRQLGYDIMSWEVLLGRLAPVLTAHKLVIVTDDVDVTRINDTCHVVVEVSIVYAPTGEKVTVTRHASHPLQIGSRRSNNPEGAARTYAERDAISRLLSIPSTGTPEETEAAPPAPEPEDASLEEELRREIWDVVQRVKKKGTTADKAAVRAAFTGHSVKMTVAGLAAVDDHEELDSLLDDINAHLAAPPAPKYEPDTDTY